MSELPYERHFRAWCDLNRVEWRTFFYSRPEAGGETQAHHLLPAGEPLGGVLVVHGAGNDALFSLTRLFSELLQRRLEVFTFDVDGHGRHSSALLSTAGLETMIPAALRAWGKQVRERPLHAIGISLGGSLLLHALPRLGSALTSAVLVAAPLRVELSRAAILREVGAPMLRTIWRERSWFGLTGLIPSFGPFRRGAFPLRLEDAPGPGAFGYVQVLNRMLDRLDLPAAARATEVPTLLVYGARDRLVPREQAETLARALPTAEVLVLPGETHLSTPMSPIARGRILEWLRRQNSAPRTAA
ncbi:MAG TPA: alpha/beta fold hydrolase [Longimicrobiaceae bacterium]